jgi:regulator of replication initiation timing|tara:strand:- start:156 stop:404 length:249 start_codon:yes stop_codon:yes gene_type:complete
MKKSRSILEELNSISVDRNKHHVLENRVEHLVSSVSNIKEILYSLYEEDVALDLERRLINSIKSGDPKKFSRGISKAVKEPK